MDWLQRGTGYVSSKLDNSTKCTCRKVYRENHGQQRSEVDCRRKKLSWSKNEEIYLLGSGTITISISDCNVDTQSHIYEKHWKIYASQIARKDHSSNVHERHHTVCQKKGKKKTVIHTVRIYRKNIGMDLAWKMCHINKNKRQMTSAGYNRTTNKKKNKNARRKKKLTDTWEYWKLGILEVVTINLDERKKVKKIMSRERRNYRKPNCIARISWKG